MVLDPLARNAPFPGNRGNRIPADRFNSIAVKMLDYYPLPNWPSIQQLHNAGALDNRWDSFVDKIDRSNHCFDDKNSIAFRRQVRVPRLSIV